MTIIALIPARSGSTRIPDKNIKPLAGHPLIAYTIAAAKASGIFSRVIVSSDSREYLHIAAQYGAETIQRPDDLACPFSEDIEWVKHALETLGGDHYDAFSILRPTNPFRQPWTIRRAWDEFKGDAWCDSLRAVRKVREHPNKMWTLYGQRMRPYAKDVTDGHNLPYQALPEVYIQTAALEIAHTKTVYQFDSVSGRKVRPFFMPDHETLDINTWEDWEIAEHRVKYGTAQLPEVK